MPPGEKTLDGRRALLDKYADSFGTKWIVLPNPAYGSWEGAVTAGVASSDDAAILARKYAMLSLAR